MQKRGMVSPVFKYIMALLVGTMFLLFFIGFGVNYLKQQESVQAFIITTGFDDVLSALGSSEDSDNSYNFGATTTLAFKPGQTGRNYFEMENKGKKIRSYKILYTPKTLTGSSLIIITKRWFLPYAIDNVFYLTNKQNKYILIYDEDSESLAKDIAGADAEDVTAELPKKIGAEAVSKRSVNPEKLKAQLLNFKRVTFILFEEDNSLETSLRKLKNANVIVIKPDRNDNNYGEVIFEDGKSIYLGKPMMMGAMFAIDKEAYEHALDLALNKLGVMTNIYLNKIELIQNKPQYNTCTQYVLVQQNFVALNNLIRSNSRIINDYKTLVDSLENNNEGLGGDCPEIF